MVLESLDFQKGADWYCVEGGTEVLASRMKDKIKKQNAIEFNKVVTAISYNKKVMGNIQVDVKVDGEETERTYDAVFNSAPLGAMQHMHLEGLNLNWGTKSAIRSLGYGASCKVGIRFKSLWWMDPKDLAITRGGQGKTDLPIRCCVYPSYNIYDPQDKPGVLLVSYTWSAEAERIGSLINRQSPDGERELKNLLFHDLARLHAKTDDKTDYERLHKIIEGEYLDHFAYNWYQNPRTVGAFAYFGPEQFSNLYKSLTQSDGKHIIIGEAASAHHAWVVGALESAVRGVYQFLWKHSKDKNVNEIMEAFNYVPYEEEHPDKENTGKETSEMKGPEDRKIPYLFGGVPLEYNRTEDLPLPKDATLKGKMPSRIGELARWQVFVESIRLRQEDGDTIDPKLVKADELKPILELLKNSSGKV
jgi:monoamine oxidase